MGPARAGHENRSLLGKPVNRPLMGGSVQAYIRHCRHPFVHLLLHIDHICKGAPGQGSCV